MSALDSTIAVLTAAAANVAAAARAAMEEKDKELRAAWARLEKFEPEPCNRPMCGRRVPTKASLRLLLSYGVNLPLDCALAWNVGVCSLECSEAMKPEEPSNVVPFSRGAGP